MPYLQKLLVSDSFDNEWTKNEKIVLIIKAHKPDEGTVVKIWNDFFKLLFHPLILILYKNLLIIYTIFELVETASINAYSL